MAKKPSTLINMVVALLVITAVSGGLLGLVYGMTKDTIAEVDQKKNAAAIKPRCFEDRHDPRPH